MSNEISFFCDNTDVVARIFGVGDIHANNIERQLGVVLVNRDLEIKISGDDAESVQRCKGLIQHLAKTAEMCEDLSEQTVNYAINMCVEDRLGEIGEINSECICITPKGKPIKAKTVGQKNYVKAILDNTISFGVGPAGTGKTYLAVAMAVTALRRREVNRIILTRPAVEAGEKLGFLPGDLQNKIDPYLRPLYDAMYEMLGMEGFQRHMEKGTIEIAPLAYMRGRTLDDSFIILDESQNTTPEQMKMFLTRLGFNSKAVITGDITQIDLPDGKSSGLKQALNIVSGIEGISVTYLTSRDVVRHSLVTKIIEAYDKFDKERNKPRK
ncbi:MAG: PhoH family protein [Ruminococcaceae bacterium]|nr:PhoH family protein [Oscillospiraceae bacterium]